jgi:hypothetical protein
VRSIPLVVTERARSAGDEDDLAPVVIDVGPEERDAVLLGVVLYGRDELVQAGGDDVGAAVGEHAVDLVEMDEGNGRVPVLGLRAREQMVSERGRDACDHIDARDGNLDVVAIERERRRSALEQDTIALPLSERLRRQRGRRLAAHEDLARRRRRLHRHGLARRRAGHDELAMRVADQEEVKRAAVYPHRHP